MNRYYINADNEDGESVALVVDAEHEKQAMDLWREYVTANWGDPDDCTVTCVWQLPPVSDTPMVQQWGVHITHP